jgi:hypothetical protein
VLLNANTWCCQGYSRGGVGGVVEATVIGGVVSAAQGWCSQCCLMPMRGVAEATLEEVLVVLLRLQ